MPTEPKRVRNFYISAEIEGRAGLLEGGPRASDGGFTLTISQRSNNSVKEVLRLVGKVGRTDPNKPLLIDKLLLDVYRISDTGPDTLITTIETSR